MLVNAKTPCPCGYYGDSLKACTCSDGAIKRYRRRLSGPLLDRIDIHLDVARKPYDWPAVETATSQKRVEHRIARVEDS